MQINIKVVCEFCNNTVTHKVIQDTERNGDINITIQAKPCDICMRDIVEESFRAVQARRTQLVEGDDSGDTLQTQQAGG